MDKGCFVVEPKGSSRAHHKKIVPVGSTTMWRRFSTIVAMIHFLIFSVVMPPSLIHSPGARFLFSGEMILYNRAVCSTIQVACVAPPARYCTVVKTSSFLSHSSGRSSSSSSRVIVSSDNLTLHYHLGDSIFVCWNFLELTWATMCQSWHDRALFRKAALLLFWNIPPNTILFNTDRKENGISYTWQYVI